MQVKIKGAVGVALGLSRARRWRGGEKADATGK